MKFHDIYLKKNPTPSSIKVKWCQLFLIEVVVTEHKWKLCLDRTLKLVNTVLDIHVYVLIYSVSNYI